MENWIREKTGQKKKAQAQALPLSLPASNQLPKPRIGWTNAVLELNEESDEEDVIVNDENVDDGCASATSNDLTTTPPEEDRLKSTKLSSLKLEGVDTMEEEDIIALDPQDSERQFWTDPVTNLVREVWRPGDGDGNQFEDYFDKPGVTPAEQRWRFYQLSSAHPIKHNLNEPPKFVVLDDRAVYELRSSDFPRQNLSKFWGHDFAAQGKIRHRRPHRGRGAIGDPEADGVNKYHFCPVGKSGEKYYFTGENDYTPIIYRIDEPAPQPPPKKRKIAKPPVPLGPKQHGHNQYTPKDLMVKYGAESFSHNPLYREKILLKQGRHPVALGMSANNRSLFASTPGPSMKLEIEGEMAADSEGHLKTELVNAQSTIEEQKLEIEGLQEKIVGLQSEIVALKKGVDGGEADEWEVGL